MSEKMSPGAYDQLITKEVASQLEGLPAERVLREVLEEDGVHRFKEELSFEDLPVKNLDTNFKNLEIHCRHHRVKISL
jgi:hypothetical protein